MTLHLALAKSSLALAALMPTATAAHHAHPTRDPGLPRPAHRPAPAELVALTPMSSRVRSQRADGRVTLTFV